MLCPNCGGHGKKYKHIKDGDSTYKQQKCVKCGELFHTVECHISKGTFCVVQNKKARENYRKKCMRKYQAI